MVNEFDKRYSKKLTYFGTTVVEENTQLSLFDFSCACGGEYEPFPIYKKHWGGTQEYEVCYKCLRLRYLNKGGGI